MNVFQYRDAIQALLDAHKAGAISNENLSQGGVELEALYNGQPEHTKTNPHNDSPRIVAPVVSPTGVHLAETIGEGPKLFAVSCTGEGWDGWATHLVRAADFGLAIQVGQDQYANLNPEDQPAEWMGTFIGDIV